MYKRQPHYVSPTGVVQNSLISDGCIIEGNVDFSVLFSNVTIAPGAVVNDSILMPGVVVEEGAVIQYAIVSENAVIKKNAVVGARPEDIENKEDWGVAVVGDNRTIGEGAVVAPKEMVYEDKEGVN